MRQLRIFSYLPNPRIWKATIAARLAGVDIEVRGASPKELRSWLWDFDAHPISSGEKAGSGEVPGHAGFKGQLHKTRPFSMPIRSARCRQHSVPTGASASLNRIAS
jgi:hypothetical protein